MTTIILSSKVTRPPCWKNLVSRPGLIDLLNQGLSRNLTLLSAPAGFGKTTLLTSWAETLPGPVSWYALDESDNDLPRFLTYLAASLKKAHPEFKRSTILTLLQSSSEWNLDDLLVPLLNQIGEIPGEIYLILDDYHHIDQPDIHSVVLYLAHNRTANLHLVIATRVDPSLGLPQFRAKGELTEIRGENLKFSTLDAGHFVQENFGIKLSEDDLQLLTDKTEGWIAGLQLAAISLRDHPDQSGFIKAFAGDDRYIADYLLDEALHRQSSQVQDFLLQTAILDQFCSSLCDAVTGRGGSQEILEELERLNLFLIPLDNQRKWYRYHSLFSDLLKIRVKKKDPEALPRLHKKASEWFERSDFPAQAVIHAIEGDDLPQLEKILQERMLDMLEEGESAQLQDKLQNYLTAAGKKSPWVEIAQAWSAVYAGMLAYAEDSLKTIEKDLAKNISDPEEQNKGQGHIAAIRAYIADMRGDKDQNLSQAKLALELLPEEDYLTIAFAALMLATAYHRNGQSTLAYDVLQKAIQSSQHKPISHITIDLHCLLAQTYQLLGKHQDSLDTLETAAKMARERSRILNRDLPILGFIRILKARIFYEWNQLSEATAEIDQGLDLIQSGGENDSYLAGLILSISIKAAQDDLDQALEIVKAAKRAAREIPYWKQVIEAQEALLYAKVGQIDRVKTWLESHQEQLQSELDYQYYGFYSYVIDIFLEIGNLERALALSELMLEVIETGDSVDLQLRFLVLRSVTLFKIGEEARALQMIERALQISAQSRYLRSFLDRGEQMEKLLYLAAQRGIAPKACQQILGEWPVGQISSSEKRPAAYLEQLSPREQEVLNLVAEGKSNQEIAQSLVLSLHTVKSHARNIYSKLGVKNRTEAVAKARSLGIL